MADTVDRTCSECGAATKGFCLTLGKANHGGRQEQKQVVLGGGLCDECHGKRRRAEVAALAAVKQNEYLQFARLPQRYQGIDYSGFTALEAVEAAKAWARGEVSGLCLTGDVGRGKSWLAAAAIADMIARRAADDAAREIDEGVTRRLRPVRWASVSGLMAALRRSFSDEDRAQATKVVAGNGAIVLDDLDKVNPTDFGKEVVFATLDARIAASAPVLITTNLGPRELGRKLGKAVVSRIVGECAVIEMVGPDRRVQSALELRAA